MPTCNINNNEMNRREALRLVNGDIVLRHYCYSTGSANKKNQKKLTHPECKETGVVIYKNGEGYDKNLKIRKDDEYPNLIGCWCNDVLRFQNENELLQHVEGKTHPEEFE
jgi:hypothetical protein